MALLVSRGPWTGADVDGEYAASIKWMSGEVIEFVCLDGSKHLKKGSELYTLEGS